MRPSIPDSFPEDDKSISAGDIVRWRGSLVEVRGIVSEQIGGFQQVIVAEIDGPVIRDANREAVKPYIDEVQKDVFMTLVRRAQRAEGNDPAE